MVGQVRKNPKILKRKKGDKGPAVSDGQQEKGPSRLRGPGAKSKGKKLSQALHEMQFLPQLNSKHQLSESHEDSKQEEEINGQSGNYEERLAKILEEE